MALTETRTTLPSLCLPQLSSWFLPLHPQIPGMVPPMMPGMLMPAVPVTAAVSTGADRKQLCTTALWV